MTTIAFDVMGNDNGVKPAVLSAQEFVKKNPNFKIILVGSETQIKKHLKNYKNIEILNVAKIASVKKGAMVIRDKNTSMYKAIELVKNKKADAVISSGSSAGYIAYSTIMLKRLKGVSRPAFMPIFPSTVKNKRFVVMDVGATLEVDARLMHSWAKLGVIFAKSILKTKKPKVNILNIGTEPKKGMAHHQEAATIFSKDKKINFKGFIEPKEILNYKTDVLITDGYAGNIMLKTIEGTAGTISKFLKKEFKKNPIRLIGALLSRGGFKALKNTLDFRNVGGAWVMGIDGIVIKAHGSSDKYAFMGALNQVVQAINSQALIKMKRELK